MNPDPLDEWRLCDELSVIQVALLMVGQDPTAIQYDVAKRAPINRPRGYEASFAALSHAILSGGLKATIRRTAREGNCTTKSDDEAIGTNGKGRQITYRRDPDWNKTTISVDDLKAWLRTRGIKTGFFFPGETGSPDYLNPKDPHYAPKLAAAVSAWEAVTKDATATKGKSPKNRLDTWLRRNAGQYGLTHKDGNPNETAIKEISKIANWDTKGGAPKTPGG